MTVICGICGEEKAKSQMYTGNPPVCKACHRTTSDMDEFSALRLCVQAIERRPDIHEKHRIVRALVARYAV